MKTGMGEKVSVALTNEQWDVLVSYINATEEYRKTERDLAEFEEGVAMKLERLSARAGKDASAYQDDSCTPGKAKWWDMVIEQLNIIRNEIINCRRKKEESA